MKTALTIFLLFGILTAVEGCTQPKQNKTVVNVWIPSSPSSSDPLRSNFISNEIAFRSFHAPLISRHKLGGYTGLLVDHWNSSEDKKTWTFHLRNMGANTSRDKLANAIDLNFRRIAYLCGLGKTQGDFCRIFEPRRKMKRADDAIRIVEITKDSEVRLNLANPTPDLIDIISRTSFGIALPEEYDPITGDWKDEVFPYSSTGAYSVTSRSSSEIRLQLNSNIPDYLSTQHPFNEIRIYWGGMDKKLNADIAFAHSNSIDLEKTHEFVGGPMSGISYVRCHSWKIHDSICGNPAIAGQLRGEFYRRMSELGYPIEPEFFFDPKDRSIFLKKIEGTTRINGSQSPSRMTILAASSKLSPYFSAYTDAMETTAKILDISFTKKELKASEVLRENNPSLSSYSVDFSVRGTEIDYSDISNELSSLFIDNTGLQLPDRDQKIQQIIRDAKSERLQKINSVIWSDAAIWPISHFSQGLYFRRDLFDSRSFNPMLPPGEFQWIGWK
jgi:hypothetical protein